MNVALNSREDDLPLRHPLTRFGEAHLDELKSRRRSICRIDELWEEDDFLFVAVTHDIKCRDDLLLYDVHRCHLREELPRDALCIVTESANDGIHQRIDCVCALRSGSLYRPCRLIPRNAEFLAAAHLRLLGRKTLDVGGAVHILPRHGAEGHDGIHDALRIWIDDREIQTNVHRLYEEILRHMSTRGQTERNIAHTERTVKTESFVHLAHGTQGLHRLRLLRRDRERQTVDDDILTVKTVFFCLRDNALGNCNALRRRLGESALVHRQPEDCRPVVLREWEDGIHALTLAAHRVDDDAPIRDTQSSLDHLRVCRVNLQRQINNTLHRFDDIRDDLLLIHALRTDIDVKHLRARLLLGYRKFLDIAVVLLKECLLQTLLACRIDALANDIELSVLRDAPR